METHVSRARQTFILARRHLLTAFTAVRAMKARHGAIRAWAVGHARIGTSISAHERGREDAGVGGAPLQAANSAAIVLG